LSFLSLVARNVGTKKLRSILTALAVAIGVMTVVTLGLVNHSIRNSALAIMQVGRADFTVAQKGVSDILSSSVQQADLDRLRQDPDVAQAIGVLLATKKYDAANPLFIMIGIRPDEMAGFGVNIVEGRAPAPTAQHEVLLGYQAARNLGKKVGDTFHLDNVTYKVVGLYQTGQSLGDQGAMFPLIGMQAHQRQSGQLSLLFVQVRAGVNVQAAQARIDRNFPQLVTVRTAADFGRADRSLQFINAADQGSTILAIGIGAIIVMSTMTMTFIERTREFGVLTAIGWRRSRILGLVMSEAGLIGLVGAAVGVGLSFAATKAISHLPSLAGVLHVVYTGDTFGRALYTAAGMIVLGALYPALRAAFLAPLEALRRE